MDSRQTIERLARAVDDIFAILESLPTPRDGARVLAGAHILLLKSQGTANEADARKCLKESYDAVLDGWATQTGATLTQ